MASLISTETPGPSCRQDAEGATVTAAAPQLGGLEGCTAPVQPFWGIWDKVQESTGRPSGLHQHMLIAPPSKEFHLGGHTGELSYKRRACAFPPGIGIFKRHGDKVMHSDKKRDISVS